MHSLQCGLIEYIGRNVLPKQPQIECKRFRAFTRMHELFLKSCWVQLVESTKIKNIRSGVHYCTRSCDVCETLWIGDYQYNFSLSVHIKERELSEEFVVQYFLRHSLYQCLYHSIRTRNNQLTKMSDGRKLWTLVHVYSQSHRTHWQKTQIVS